MFALASPELEVLAITVTFGTGLPFPDRKALTVIRQYHSGLLPVSASSILTPGRHQLEPPAGKTFFVCMRLLTATSRPFLATGIGFQTFPSPGRPSLRSERRARLRGIYILPNTFTAGMECFPGTTVCGVTVDSRLYSDGLGDITTRHPDLRAAIVDKGRQHPQLDISSRSAVDISLELIRSEPDKSITYIALGPLTDLSGMLKKDPALVRERLGRVVCMGGALNVPGNSTPVAECQVSSLSTQLTDG